MIAAAIVAAATMHLSSPSPTAQLAAVEREAPFHVMTLPAGFLLERAAIGRDATGAVSVRLEYSSVGTIIEIEESAPEAADATERSDAASDIFSLDGYPAIYHETGPAYRPVSSLVWYRTDLTISLGSSGANAPMLVDIALELR